MKRVLRSIATFGAISMALTGTAYASAPPPGWTSWTSGPPMAPVVPAVSTAADQIVLGNALWAPCVTAAAIDAAGFKAEALYVPAGPPAAVIVDGWWIPAGVAATQKNAIGCVG